MFFPSFFRPRISYDVRVQVGSWRLDTWESWYDRQQNGVVARASFWFCVEGLDFVYRRIRRAESVAFRSPHSGITSTEGVSGCHPCRHRRYDVRRTKS